MSDKKTYAHGFGGMNAITEVHPNCRTQSELSATSGLAAWQRGYFCAVAALIRQNGVVTTDALELFKAGGDATKADECDQEIFRKTGLMPN